MPRHRTPGASTSIAGRIDSRQSGTTTLTDNRVELVGNGYLTGEFTAGQKIEDEAQRFLTVDKQRDHFWAGIRAWTASGKSAQLWYGRLETFDAVHDVAIRYGIRPQCVFVDAQYDTDQVYSACARMNWTALHGSGQKSFAFKKQNGDITHRPFTRLPAVILRLSPAIRITLPIDAARPLTVAVTSTPRADIERSALKIR